MAYEFNHYYELQNVATGKYVNVLGNHEDGTVKNGETVNLFSRTNNPDQRWALENFGGNGNVRIVLQRGEGWYALNYNTRNTNCIVWHLNTADDTDTVITTVEVENRPNTYYLMLRDRSIYVRNAKMEILETKRGKSGVQSIVVRCGEYTAELTFCENCETDVMIPIKELIMSAYDLRKQREEQDNR